MTSVRVPAPAVGDATSVPRREWSNFFAELTANYRGRWALARIWTRGEVPRREALLVQEERFERIRVVSIAGTSVVQVEFKSDPDCVDPHRVDVWFPELVRFEPANNVRGSSLLIRQRTLTTLEFVLLGA